MESCASAWTVAARSIERCVTVSRSKDIHRTFLCVWKQSLNITQLFFLEKFLTLQYFHIFEFSSSSCLFGFGRFRCALVFLILILCVWLRENVCMCPYVCCGGRAMWRRCACDRDIERCECANDHAWVRHRQMPIRCVYMRERSSSLLVCVCVWEREKERETERGASVTQQPSLSIRPSLARSHVTHASTRTFWHPRPAPAHLKARTSLSISHAQSLREYPV